MILRSPEKFGIHLGSRNMNECERTASPSSVDEPGSAGPLSPNTAQELQSVLQQAEAQNFRLNGDDLPSESYSCENTTELQGEDLMKFKRRRNAFHSRKKRRRKKLYLERLQMCFERVSNENTKLKDQHARLVSGVEKAEKLVQHIESGRASVSAPQRLHHSGQQETLHTLALQQPQPMNIPPSISNSQQVPSAYSLSPLELAALSQQAAENQRVALLLQVSSAHLPINHSHQLLSGSAIHGPEPYNNIPAVSNFNMFPHVGPATAGVEAASAARARVETALALEEYRQRQSLNAIAAAQIQQQTQQQLQLQQRLHQELLYLQRSDPPTQSFVTHNSANLHSVPITAQILEEEKQSISATSELAPNTAFLRGTDSPQMQDGGN